MTIKITDGARARIIEYFERKNLPTAVLTKSDKAFQNDDIVADAARLTNYNSTGNTEIKLNDRVSLHIDQRYGNSLEHKTLDIADRPHDNYGGFLQSFKII